MHCRAETIARAAIAVVAPAMWIAFDWLRHQGEVAFPWFSVGYSQVAASPLAGYAPLGGVLLMGFVTVLIGALLAVAVLRRDLRSCTLLAALHCWRSARDCRHVAWTDRVGMRASHRCTAGKYRRTHKFDARRCHARCRGTNR